MQTGVGNVVLADGGGYCAHVADVLDHGCERQGDDGEECAQEHAGVNVHVEQVEHAVFPYDGQTEPLCRRDLLDDCHAGGGVNDHGDDVGADNTEEDGDYLGHALAPDVEVDDDEYRNDSYDPVLAAVIDRRGGQDQTDGDDDGAGDYRGKELHDLLYAEGFEEDRQNNIHKSRAGDAEAGVNEQVVIVYGLASCVNADRADRVVAADEGEGGAEECGNLALGEEVEQQSAETCE